MSECLNKTVFTFHGDKGNNAIRYVLQHTAGNSGWNSVALEELEMPN